MCCEQVLKLRLYTTRCRASPHVAVRCRLQRRMWCECSFSHSRSGDWNYRRSPIALLCEFHLNSISCKTKRNARLPDTVKSSFLSARRYARAAYAMAVMVGHAHTCLKYHFTEYGTRTSKHKVKHDICKTWKLYSCKVLYNRIWVPSINAWYCFATSATKSLNAVVTCIECHQSSAKYPGKEVGWTLFAFLKIFKRAYTSKLFQSFVC